MILRADSHVVSLVKNIIVVSEREKFCPRPGLEPGPLAFRANALRLSHPGQVRVHDRINLLEATFLTSGPTDYVVIMSYECLPPGPEARRDGSKRLILSWTLTCLR